MCSKSFQINSWCLSLEILEMHTIYSTYRYCNASIYEILFFSYVLFTIIKFNLIWNPCALFLFYFYFIFFQFIFVCKMIFFGQILNARRNNCSIEVSLSKKKNSQNFEFWIRILENYFRMIFFSSVCACVCVAFAKVLRTFMLQEKVNEK